MNTELKRLEERVAALEKLFRTDFRRQVRARKRLEVENGALVKALLRKTLLTRDDIEAEKPTRTKADAGVADERV